MAWFDDYLQRGKGLIQRGQNYFTGNNLTSQDPNTIRAMNAQPFDANAVISDSGGIHQGAGPIPFSDLSYQDTEGRHPPLSHSGLRSIMPHDVGNWRNEMNPNLVDWSAPYQPDRPFPHGGFEEMQFDERSQQPQKKGFQFPNIGITGILQGIKDQFQRPQEMQTAYEAITGSADDEGYGKYKGNEYRIEDTPTGKKIFSELYPHGKNLDSWRGSKSIEEMENEGYGSIGWAQERLQKGKDISQRLKNILKSRGIGEGGNFINRPTNEGAQFGTPVAIPPVAIKQNIPHDTGGATPTPQSWNRDQGGGYTTARGFTKADTGGRGHHGNWAQGGRVGYAFAGPVGAEQQDFIEGPQGANEFQETVVEGQEQPSREQLEALAMHIFQLPLDDLDDEQLVVVYQAAMQEQPMEEAVQEEDVQFAANGGLAGLL